MKTQALISFLTYFGILLSVGLLFSKKKMSSADFLMGNRSLNFWLTALTAHASDMSSWLFMAFPAAIFLGGFSQFWIAVGLFFGMFLNWQLVAKGLRTMTEKYETYTLSSFFERRFADQSGVIRIATALMTIFFLTCYVSAGLIAVGDIFESVFNINFYLGLTIACIVITAYTYMGGFVTVAYTDFFQAIFLLFVILIVPAHAYMSLENEGVLSVEKIKNFSTEWFPSYSWSTVMATIFTILSWGLGYFGQPHVVTKFMGIRNPNEINKSKYFGMAWMAIALASATAVGIVGMAYFPQGIQNPELVFIEMVKSLYFPLVAGFILCGVLAASISTMDSQILVCASVLSEDFYKHFFHKDATPKQLLNVSRVGVILIAALSLFFALNKNSTILEAVLYAWSGLGSAFGPLVLMSLYYKKANKYGAVAGILVGGIVAGIWNPVNPHVIDFQIPSMIPGFFTSLLSIYVVSVLTTSEAILREKNT